MSKREDARRAAHAHTNLNTWGCVIAILEGSLLYGDSSQHRAATTVINIAKKEEQKFLRIFDSAMDDVSSVRGIPK